MKLRTVLLGLAAAALAGSVVPAGAVDSVAIDSTQVQGSRVTVTGSAAFSTAETEVADDTFVTPLDPPEAAGPLGIDLRSASISPLADGSGLRFTWQMSSLPPSVPPEGVRYTWAFRIGDSRYQLQAKLTNLASITTTEAPMDHLLQVPVGTFFQLRGACEDNYRGTPTAGCYHLAFLGGNFDYTNGRVNVDMPWRTRDQLGRIVAGDFVPGVVLEEDLAAGMSIAASLQAFVSNTTVSQYIVGWETYASGGPVVSLGVGAAGSNPGSIAYDDEAVVEDGAFGGTARGFGGANDTVFARACDVSGCAYASATPPPTP